MMISRYPGKLVPRVKECKRFPGELSVAPLARLLADFDLYGEEVHRPLHVFDLGEGRKAIFGLRGQPEVIGAFEEMDIHLPGEIGQPESYAIGISHDTIRVAGSDWRGLFYGLLTLNDIAALGEPLECVTIFDWPDFDMRGMQFLHCMNQWAPIGVDPRNPPRWDHYKEDLDRCKAEDSIPPEVYDAGRPFVRFDEDLALEIARQLARMKTNTVMLVTGDTVNWISHPEIALEDAWSIERFADFVQKLEALHLEVMPGFNFSPTHSIWLGKYHARLNTPEYSQVVKDLIAELASLCPNSSRFHLGMDEEDYGHFASRGMWPSYLRPTHEQLGHLDWMSDVVADHGMRANAYCDVLMHPKSNAWHWRLLDNYAGLVDRIRRKVDIIDWMTYASSEWAQVTKTPPSTVDLLEHGFSVIAASYVLSQSDGAANSVARRVQSQLSAQQKLVGLIETVWQPMMRGWSAEKAQFRAARTSAAAFWHALGAEEVD